VRAVSRRGQLDAAVLLLVLSRGWAFVGGPVTIVLLSWFLTPEEQGFYYTFGSLIALQSFLELSFSIVVLQFASHEWAHLTLDAHGRITGDETARSRLISIMRITARWYAVVAVLFAVVVGIAGYTFLGQRGAAAGPWVGPWVVLVVVTAAQLWLMPFLSIVEGCGFVREINAARLAQAVGGSVAIWVVFMLGGGLWALPVSGAVTLAVSLALIFGRFGAFFAPMWREALSATLHWRREMWPMQWRLAGSGSVNYLALSTFVPIVFYFHGAAEAGRTGLTWQMASAAAAVSQAWLFPRVPAFGGLAARRAWAELDRLFFRTTGITAVMAALAGLAVLTFVVGAHAADVWIAERMLTPLATGMLVAAFFFVRISECESAYLHAHRQAPLLALSVVVSVSTALLTLLLGARYGGTGAALAFLLANALILVPGETLLLRYLRRVWHAEPSA